jgi:hypothetical protein
MKPSTFYQWWNGLFHGRPPEDDCVEWALDFLGFFPVNVAIIAIFFGGFSLWLWYTDRKWDRDYKKMLKELGGQRDA